MELWQLRQMQSLPLEVKIEKSKQRIKEWYEAFDGQVYVSFSGGKDSTVLLHLVRSMYPDVPAVFVDTGLEFPEIKEFVRSVDNVEPLKPKMNFRQVIEKYGYPAVSKEISYKIYCAKVTKSERRKNRILHGINYDGSKTRFRVSKKWLCLMDAPFKVSDQCCNVMKKKPIKKYEKETGRKAFIGTTAGESEIRTQMYLKNGCNAFENKRPISVPISFWMENDIWDYFKKFSLPHSKIYDMGYLGTGCMFCMFGCHLEKQPNRFQRMKLTHPQLYHYCMKPWSDGGLGLAEVLDYIHVPYGDYVPCLKDYEQIKMDT